MPQNEEILLADLIEHLRRELLDAMARGAEAELKFLLAQLSWTSRSTQQERVVAAAV